MTPNENEMTFADITFCGNNEIHIYLQLNEEVFSLHKNMRCAGVIQTKSPVTDINMKTNRDAVASACCTANFSRHR